MTLGIANDDIWICQISGKLVFRFFFVISLLFLIKENFALENKKKPTPVLKGLKGKEASLACNSIKGELWFT